MKKLVILMALITITSCSKPMGQKVQISEPSTTVIQTTENIIFDGPKLADPNASDSIGLGKATPTVSPTKRVVIINSLTANITLDLTDLNNKIALNSRLKLGPLAGQCASGILRPNKSCIIELMLNYVENEDYTQSIIVNLINNPANTEFGKLIITGSKQADISATLPMTDTLRLSSISSSYSLSADAPSSVKRFYLSNISNAPLNSPTVIAPVNGSLMNDNCSNQQIKSLRNCYFEVKYTYDSSKPLMSEAVQFESVDNSMDTSGVSIALSISNKISQTVSNLQLIYISPIKKIDSSDSSRLYVNNTGNVSQNPALIVPSPFSLKSTNCGASLGIGKSCYYDLIIDPSKKTNLIGAQKI